MIQPTKQSSSTNGRPELKHAVCHGGVFAPYNPGEACALSNPDHSKSADIAATEERKEAAVLERGREQNDGVPGQASTS